MNNASRAQLLQDMIYSITPPLDPRPSWGGEANPKNRCFGGYTVKAPVISITLLS